MYFETPHSPPPPPCNYFPADRRFACTQERTEEILRDGGGRNHVMNLGHGIDANTPEENAAFFVETVKNFRF